MLNPCVTVKFGRIVGWRIFMQGRQKIFKCFTMQICRLFFTAFWNFWRITRLSTTNHRWVINAQTGPFFGPPCSIQLTPQYIIWQYVKGAEKTVGGSTSSILFSPSISSTLLCSYTYLQYYVFWYYVYYKFFWCQKLNICVAAYCFHHAKKCSIITVRREVF